MGLNSVFKEPERTPSRGYDTHPDDRDAQYVPWLEERLRRTGSWSRS